MVHPSSAGGKDQELALQEYLQLGGNCIHLHEEGGGVVSRQATGKWLERRGLRASFFLCSQICHAGWDDIGQRSIDRFTPEAISEDVETDLDLLASKYLDMVYLDDNPESPAEPMLEALCREIARGRIKAFGFRNWAAARINRAHQHLASEKLPCPTVIVTTELALASTTAPLWPEYLPFDSELQRTITELGLAVFAHAADINLGQSLHARGETTHLRQHWRQRWEHPSNQQLVPRVRQFATAHGLTPRAVNVAWLLNQAFPSVAIVPLPSVQSRVRTDYERGSELILNQADVAWLKDGA